MCSTFLRSLPHSKKTLHLVVVTFGRHVKLEETWVLRREKRVALIGVHELELRNGDSGVDI